MNPKVGEEWYVRQYDGVIMKATVMAKTSEGGFINEIPDLPHRYHGKTATYLTKIPRRYYLRFWKNWRQG